ncbi:MAG TPA: pyridoxamine 5'-phosphate oxidase family protein [Candidatus Erysipelatoclostridium merdavium]|uniref:Pyridoxamine 5'-phosphate oxidase family protein n=1 Tax=Candidatus Erysipelatoclostridium merdavium TaxID=2838566 RepID=A0A9D2BN36_9FIRM|nr:pyridoxamine 5'-phosphate oxidase family protein [Candidatus Erysipelatoclostridium merdavium]
MEPKFQLKLNQIYKQIGDHAKIVLATSHQNIVSARKMSFIINDGHFYFQTDCTFRKYHDIKENNYVALCLDNIQIEGICTELGHPLSHIEFIKKFKKYFLSSFNAYSSLDSERLFMIKPLFIQRWNYIDGKPIIEQFFIDQCKYIEKKYNTTS